MQFFSGLDDVPEGFGPSAVTIGKFDGVHSGHRAVIAELLQVAAELDVVPTVVTFDRHPLSLLAPESCPEALLSNPQKVERLAETGVAATLMLAFDRELSRQTPEHFVREVLAEALDARVVLVGSDFRFGARGAGTVATLEALGERHGFEVRLIDDVVSRGGERASSTSIRRLLAEGRIAQATEMLEHPPTVRSIVVPGERRGRELGFPTANLDPAIEGFIPADGVYAAWLTVDGVTYPAAVSIGNNPTFEGVPERQVEAYVLDEDIDLYGRTVELSFVERIRGMVKFDGLDALIAELGRDVEATRGILAGVERPPT